MIVCGNCSRETDESRNFCTSCGHKIRDLRGIGNRPVWGAGSDPSNKMDYFWSTGDPAVFAAPDAPDYRPELGAL